MRQITTARDLAIAVKDVQGITYGAKNVNEAAWKWIKSNMPKAWQWPVYILATSEFAENDAWIEETI